MIHYINSSIIALKSYINYQHVYKAEDSLVLYIIYFFLLLSYMHNLHHVVDILYSLYMMV